MQKVTPAVHPMPPAILTQAVHWNHSGNPTHRKNTGITAGQKYRETPDVPAQPSSHEDLYQVCADFMLYVAASAGGWWNTGYDAPALLEPAASHHSSVPPHGAKLKQYPPVTYRKLP